jgi:hypothetical protein
VLPAEGWRELSRVSVVRPDARGGIDDGMGVRLVQVSPEALWLTATAGSWWVPMDQPLAHLAVAALEPDTPFSAYAQRLLPTLHSAARVLAVPRLLPERHDTP